MEMNYLADIYEYWATPNPFKNKQKFQKIRKRQMLFIKKQPLAGHSGARLWSHYSGKWRQASLVYKVSPEQPRLHGETLSWNKTKQKPSL